MTAVGREGKRGAAEFLSLAREYEAVPVVRSFLADLSTPVGAFLRLRARSPSAFLLESIVGGERVSRYSFLGSDPYLTLRARGDDVRETSRAGERVLAETFWQIARERLRPRRQPRIQGHPPFVGGAVGYAGYGCARWFEPILGRERRQDAAQDGFPAFDDALLLFFRTVVAFDHAHQRVHVGSLVTTESLESDEERLRAYEEARAEIAAVEAILAGPPGLEAWEDPQPEIGGSPEPRPPPSRSVPDQSGFVEAVKRAQDHIRAGDAFQIVLSRRLECELAADPLLVYRALRTIDPAPYMFFLQSEDTVVLGASPETLVRCEGRRLWYRPIAGTRPRAADEQADRVLEAELRADPKEVAEHVMLVDLGRNDLGRVATTGSVRVDRLMDVERYANVMHLVSELTAELRDELDALDALAACFPAGTVSGAPKVRAMQIIDALEPVPRGLYGGAVLYHDFAGNLDSCIAIRMLVARGGKAFLQAGAGIVVDSVPERELAETEAKTGALLRAIALAESWLT
ncbi:MAG: anthranilate synthase component I family protein [Gemmatimonadetes bacterium]|nr:anthranilate synthase component I family protein [Gemmatimonadota bacterium]